MYDCVRIYCDRPPTVEFRDGLFHITERISDQVTLRRCYPPSVFMAGIVACLDAIEKFGGAQGNVIPMLRKAAG